jgi:tocopherol O-methyltransferase
MLSLITTVLPASTATASSPASRSRSAVESPQDLRSPEQLRSGIANFYDRSSKLWERTWGEHMHHGYYPNGEKKNHVQAQVDMIDGVLAWAGVDEKKPASVLDVGCGIGGSTRHIVRKYGCTGQGITLSPVQAGRAQQLSDEQGLGDKLGFQVADALRMPFADNSFDLVWSLESGEHMPDKRQFVSELTRVVKPGGRVIIVTWCHRDLEAGEEGLRPREERLLRTINRAFYLPRWCSVADYVGLARDFGLQGVRTDDWTDDIAQFWPAVIASAFTWRGFTGLFRSGLTTLRGALVMPLMSLGYKLGLIKFGLITATKPIAAAVKVAATAAITTGLPAAAKAKAKPASRPSTPKPAAPEPAAAKPLEAVKAVVKRVQSQSRSYEPLPPSGFEWGGTF